MNYEIKLSVEIEQVCKDVLDIDDTVRFSMIVKAGVKKFGGYRYNTVGILDSDELDQSIWHANERMVGRKMAEQKLGKTKYAMAEYERVKRITFPLENKKLLLVSVDVDSDHNKIIKKILKMLEQV